MKSWKNNQWYLTKDIETIETAEHFFISILERDTAELQWL